MSETGSKCVVLIPAFNESRQISEVVRAVRQALPAADYVVIDDGSSDDTSEKARQQGAQVLCHPFQLGYGVALQTGYKFAVRRPYQVILQVDGDGQHDPRHLPEMVSLIKGGSVDLVLGSRFLFPGSYRSTFLRRLGIFFFNAIVGALTRKRFTDSTSGYQAFGREILSFYVSDAYPWDYPDADVLLTLVFAKFRIQEIPVCMHPPRQNQSMHAGFLRPFYYVLKMLLSISVTLLRGPIRLKQGDR